MATHNSHRRSRTVFLAVGSATAALVLSSCSGAAPASNASAGGDNLANSSVSMGVPIQESGESSYKVLAEAYMKEFPDRKIVVNELPNNGFAQALRTQLQAGNADDIIYVTPGGGNPQALLPFVKAGYIEPLTDPASIATVPESSKPAFEVDGKTYAQALDLTPVASVVNETALAADGLSMPKTEAEMLSTCKAAKDKGKSLYVLAGKMPGNTGLAAMVFAGSRVYAETPDWNAKRAAGEVTFADSGWRDVLELFVKMNEAGCFQEGVAGGDFNAITNGLGRGSSYAGFIPGGGSNVAQAVPDSTFAVHPFPAAAEADTRLLASVNNALAITAKADNKEAAQAFLTWLAKPENQVAYAKASANLPVGTTDTGELSEEFKHIAPLLESGDYVPLPSQGWEKPEVYTALGTGIQGLFTGQTTVDAVLASMDSAWG